MNIVPRTSIIIYLKHMKHERQVRKFGHIVSTNRQERFVVMYINEDEADQIVDKLMRLKYVKHVEGSPYKYLKKVYEKEQHEVL
ncbi:MULTISPECIES: YlbG family protein [Staphylococcus]|uniref:YlbG family protein n=1 Tax=Staphylococcus TaxID=1279 RepID=UPI0002DC19CB|nr:MULTISPECIES: DUF2129 domain-containing protein [Staphylococcus]MBF2752588.1 DUF2129 domain-containing protein [Staphylococcus saprophyticus]MBF2779040.1 DUF2129 domain-containing protein [Staphylococcus saprophyticus]MBF2780877.1 DUF2129 domain-containing protein [Staphylococcus saprophyticus]MBN6091836.1 DUF2129 domain-containing protein [Staphylococcus saprophyticus]MBN6203426.1 DUF2129 domain-containing protein [Staphylococcus saprophyticus]